MNKVKKWLKKRWYYVVMGLAGASFLIVVLVLRGKTNGLSDVLLKSLDNYGAKIRKLNELDKEKEERKEIVEKKFAQESERIEQEDKEAREKIEDEKKDEVVALSAKSSEELAEKLKEEFKI